MLLVIVFFCVCVYSAQLQKDQALLEHLHQQELRKKESLKAAEAKVARMKEQLLASERVVSANRLLLKKLQEQVRQVQKLKLHYNRTQQAIRKELIYLNRGVEDGEGFCVNLVVIQGPFLNVMQIPRA